MEQSSPLRFRKNCGQKFFEKWANGQFCCKPKLTKNFYGQKKWANGQFCEKKWAEKNLTLVKDALTIVKEFGKKWPFLRVF